MHAGRSKVSITEFLDKVQLEKLGKLGVEHLHASDWCGGKSNFTPIAILAKNKCKFLWAKSLSPTEKDSKETHLMY